MATLIPALGACVSRMTGGERRLAERLEQKLDADYLLWYDVPMGPRNAHPDFCVMHPRRGILVLEVKDWKLSTIGQADKQTWTIIPDGMPKTVINPLEQARQYTHQVVGALERDPQLVQADGIPLVKPISCGREGQAPILIKLPSLREEAYAIADQLATAHKEGHAWGDMALLCADWKTMDLCADALHQRKLPFNVRKRTGEYNPAADAIQIMTMKVSKGLEFPVVALPGVGHMPAPGEDEKEAARVFYVAATRATQRLVIGVGGDGGFGRSLSIGPATALGLFATRG